MDDSKTLPEDSLADTNSIESGSNNIDAEIEKAMTQDDVIMVHVGGSSYELEIDDIRRSPSSRIYKNVFNDKRNSLVFKRPIQSFEAVLAYYQTGELHMPLSVCPGAFKTELEFWQLDPQIMMKCCYYRYLSHQDDQETLDKFHQHLFPVSDIEKSQRCLTGLRSKLWNVMDFQNKTAFTKVYFYMCTLMVVCSVMTLALSSVPFYRRNLTKCELEEYLGRPISSLDGRPMDNDTCDDPLTDDDYSHIVVDYEKVQIKDPKELRETDVILNGVAVDDESTEQTGENRESLDESEQGQNMSKLSRSFLDFSFNKQDTVSNTALLDQIIDALRPRVGLSKKTVRIQAIVYADTIVLAFFTIDVLLRVLCCPDVKKYFLSIINLFDALAVLSAYAHMTVNFMRTSERYEVSNYDVLEIFQVLRVVRLLRIVRDVTGFKVLSFSLRISLKDLLVLFLYMMLGVLIFANFIFFVESEMDIQSIPTGWWWAISTLTTVGYGDVVPKSLYGRIIGGLCAISGVVMMAVAIPVFVKTFLLLYAYAVLYKKSLHRPEDTHRYIHRIGCQKAAASRQRGYVNEGYGGAGVKEH